MSLTLADIGVADALLPYRSQRWDNAGQEQHYLDEGSGDPVVMVHGNPSWCFRWRNAVAALRSDYRCIVPDHIGCGLSSRPSARRLCRGSTPLPWVRPTLRSRGRR